MDKIEKLKKLVDRLESIGDAMAGLHDYLVMMALAKEFKDVVAELKEELEDE